jgi:hypothetical protein
MTSTIILNVKTPVNLREIYVIERVLPRDLERLALKTGRDRDRLEAFRSNIRFIDGSNMLVTQSFEEIAEKTGHRLLTVRSQPGENGRPEAVQVVPIDAIRHLEVIGDDDRKAMKERYGETDPARIDALKTRVVYTLVDPHTANAGRAYFFRKMFPVDIEKDIHEGQKRQAIGIGNGRFLLASEIADAHNLSEDELASLSDKYNLHSADGDLVTSITLRSGDLILSPFPAEEITSQIKRPAQKRTVSRRAAPPVRRAAMK